jgi:hypothetical protein
METMPLSTNLPGGNVTINGNVIVKGNGSKNGLFQAGSMTVNGNFTNDRPSSNTNITGNMTVTGNMEVFGGRMSVVKAIVTVGGNYIQKESNTQISGGPGDINNDITNCGAFYVRGNRELEDGVFGQSGLLGMCGSNGNISGFTKIESRARIGAGGNLGCSCYQALPITLIYFTAKQQESQVLLQWATASEKDNEYFSLEKSRDGQQFNEIGRVVGAGTSTGKLTYQFTDDFPFGGTGYYRLKQVDFDGTFTYSRIVAVNSQISAALRIYPNPLAGNELWVEATDAQADDMRITIHNTLGKLLVDRVYAYEPAVKMDLSALRREPGLYIISVRRKSRIERQKLVIQ